MKIIPIRQYTSNGCRLISKYRKGLIETVNVETDFGKGLTTITTLFDKNNSLVSRVIEKRARKKPIEKTVISYEGYYENRRKTTIEKFINKHRVQKIVKSEVKNRQGFLTRLVISFTPEKNKSRLETQIIEELSTKKHRRFIKTTARRLKDGTIIDRTIEGNVEHLSEFAKSPYFYFRGYSPKDFLISIIPYAKELQKVSKRKINILFDTLHKNVAANSQSVDGEGVVTFDMSKLSRLSVIVDSVNHEFRHQYQNQTIENFEKKGFRGLLQRIFKPFQRRFAKRCKNDFENYISAAQDKEKYSRQFVELDAKTAGAKAMSEFRKETGLLDILFPYSKELFTGDDEFFRLLDNIRNAKIKGQSKSKST